MFSYGVGEVGYLVQEQGFNLLLLFYYQQIVGLPGTLTGIALMISMVVDAITDPIIGGWSDRLKNRFGRRHPFILASAIPLGVSFVLLFSPPDGLEDIGSFLWLTVFAVLVRFCMTLYYIPHMALGAEMADDYSQRSTLFAFSGLIGAITAATTHFSIYIFIFPTTEEFNPGTLDPAGYPRFAWIGAIIMIAALFLLCLGHKARDTISQTNAKRFQIIACDRTLGHDRDFQEQKFLHTVPGIVPHGNRRCGSPGF